MNKKSGFTLAETVITIFIFTILALGAGTLFSHLLSSSRNNLINLESADEARRVMNQIIDELRFAPTGISGESPITEASETSISFNGVRYYKEDDRLMRSEDSKTRVVLNSLDDQSIIFTYFDKNYTGNQSPLTTPIEIKNIAFIKVGLKGYKISLEGSVGPRNLN